MTNIQQIFVNKPGISSPLDISPVAGRIGADIKGVQLSGDLSPDTIAAIRVALARHKVIFFRDQFDFDDAKQESSAAALASTLKDRFGTHRAAFASTVYETEHPVVHVHPETGERTLLAGNFLKNFVGLDSADSSRLLGILQDHITRPENTVRWRWRLGDVAIWDNRATQHRAIADFGLQRRHHRRVTIAGKVPVGIDGKGSRAVKPTPQPEVRAAE